MKQIADGDFWLDDWTSTLSAEPEDMDAYCIVNEIDMISDKPDITLSAMSPYDDIGKSIPLDAVADHLRADNISRPIHMTVVHHSATSAATDQGLDTVKAFARYHMQTNGWAALGYHIVIDTKGTIWRGRKMNYTGAHAGPNGNPGSIGICLTGNFAARDVPTLAQKRSLAVLHTNLGAIYYGNDRSRVRFHREFMNRTCPGKITQEEVMGWVETYGRPEPIVGSGVVIRERRSGNMICMGTRVGNTTYMPVRTLFEKFGYKVDWMPEQNVVMLTPEGEEPRTTSPVSGEVVKPKIVLGDRLITSGIRMYGDSVYSRTRPTLEPIGFDVDWWNGEVVIGR